MNITNILQEFRIVEAKSLSKKSGFTDFTIMEVEDQDTILNTEDLAEKSSVTVVLCTDKNYNKDKITKKDGFSIKVSELFKFMKDTIPDFEKDDYVEFGPGYLLSDLIGTYIQREFELTWHKQYTDMQRIMDRVVVSESDDKSKFDVGDRVRVILDGSPRFGMVGTVQSVKDENEKPIKVKFKQIDHPVFFTKADLKKTK